MIVAIGICWQACKKEELRYPSVTILEPFVNSQVKVLDTIKIKATVSDPTLRSIAVTLVNEDFNPVISSISIPVNSTSETFTTYLPINNAALETGVYKVRVKAWNDQISGSGFRDIGVEGIPLERLGWYILCSDSLSNNLYYLPSVGNRSLVRSGTGFPSGLAVQSSIRRCAVSESNSLELFDTDSQGSVYVDNFPVQIENTLALDKNIAVLMNNGFVHLRNEDGAIIGSLALPSGYQPYHVGVFGNEYVVFSYQPNSGNKLTTYSRNTLLKNNDQHIGGYQVINSFERNNDLYIIGNLNGKAFVNRMSASGSLTEIGIPTNDRLLSGVLVNTLLYVSMESEMHKIDVDINYTTKENLSIIPTYMVYDELSDEILISEGINLRIMTGDLNQVKRSLNLPSEIIRQYAHYSR